MRFRPFALRVAAVVLAATSMSAFSSSAHADAGPGQHTVTVTGGTALVTKTYTVSYLSKRKRGSVRGTYRAKGTYTYKGRRYTRTGTYKLITYGTASSRSTKKNVARIVVNDRVSACTKPTMGAATQCAKAAANAKALVTAEDRFRSHYAASVARDRAAVAKTAKTNAGRRALAAAKKVRVTSAMKKRAFAAAKKDGVRRAKAAATAKPKPTTGPVARAVPQALGLVNAERAKVNLRALTASSCAQRFANSQAVAQAKAKSMHHTKNLYTVLNGCKSNTAGENVAYGYSDAAAVMGGWMDSPGHRANALRKTFTAVAVAVAYSSDGTPYYAQVFLG